MAFVSQVKNRVRVRGKPSISFRLIKSGSAGVHVSKLTRLYGACIDIEIDEERKVLRLVLHPEGFQVGKTGSFSCSKKIFRTISPKSNRSVTIPLRVGEDGLLYGSYAHLAQEQK